MKHAKSLDSRKGITGLDIFFLILLTVGAIVIIIPFWNVVVVSFSSQKEYADNPLMLFPQHPTWESYTYLFKDGRVWQGYFNTFKLLVMGLALSLFLTSSMAYGLSREHFPGKRIIIYLVLFTMIFNGGIVPLYLIMKQLNLTGNLWSVTMATCFNAFNMILMMNYFRSLPKSLMESAQLDGAGEWTILFKIVLPLSAPIMATITLFYGVGIWNEWYNAMIFLRKEAQMPLQNILRSIIQESQIDTSAIGTSAASNSPRFSEGIKMAAVFATMVPIMCFFPLLQKHFTKGVMIGAIKM